MFLNNSASSRFILTNNDNSSALRRSKSNGEKVLKTTSFNENAVKTPHRSKDASTKSGQATQRRRRALGDISNRKGAAGGGGSGKKGGVVLKQSLSNNVTQGALKSGNSKVFFPSSSTKSRASQVQFSKTPSTKSASVNKARVGESGVKSSTCKPKKCPSSNEYDGVFGVTTRWSNFSFEDEGRSLFDPLPEEELDMVEKIREERSNRREKERMERDRRDGERSEQCFAESIREVDEATRKDIADLIISSEKGNCDDDGWDLLDQKLPWEHEDGEYDPAEERRLSGADPFSMWGDDFLTV